MVDVGVWSNVAVAFGTLALAAAAFRQSQLIIQDRKVQLARDLLDNVYGLLHPWTKKWRSKFWILKGLNLEPWTKVRLYKPHLTARIPRALVDSLDTLEESGRAIHNIRNRVLQAVYPCLEEIARQILDVTHPDGRGVTIRLWVDGSSNVGDADLLDLWLMEEDLRRWAERVALEHRATSWEIVALHAGFDAGKTNEALILESRVNEFLNGLPAATGLRETLQKAVGAGKAAADAVESEIKRLSQLLDKAGY